MNGWAARDGNAIPYALVDAPRGSGGHGSNGEASNIKSNLF